MLLLVLLVSLLLLLLAGETTAGGSRRDFFTSEGFQRVSVGLAASRRGRRAALTTLVGKCWHLCGTGGGVVMGRVRTTRRARRGS